MSAGTRLFTAVSLDPRAHESLAAVVARLAGTASRADGGPRWTQPATWHVTLVFLGEVDPSALPALRAGLARGADGMAPFALRCAGLGTFPRSGPPRVLWAGLDGELDRLTRLFRAVRRAARGGGVPVPAEPFTPHVTLGRWRSGQARRPEALDALGGSYVGPEFAVDHFALLRSHLPTGPGVGPRYEVLDRWHLGGP